jgi:hypothetical protein
MINKVYGLYSGPNLPHSSTNYPLVDHSPRSLSEPLHHEVDIDTERIDGAVAYNVFTLNHIREVLHGSPASVTEDQNGTSALYALPSMFNHSCDPGTFWHCFGDLLVIRSTRDISKGAEITLAFAVGSTHELRKEDLQAFLPNTCDCSLCEEERADGSDACRKREDLVQQLYANYQREATSLPNDKTVVESQIQQLTATFAPSSHPRVRPALFEPHIRAMGSWLLKL